MFTLKELAIRSFEYAVKANQDLVTQFDTATSCFFVVSSGTIEAWVQGRGRMRVYERGQCFAFQKGLDLGSGGPQLREASYRGGTPKSTVVQIWLNDLAEQAPTVSVPLHDGIARPPCFSSFGILKQSAGPDAATLNFPELLHRSEEMS
eukprot:COSAG05_NODE_1795_length_4077_cov_2.741830_4_plen_149_part_00